MNEKTGTYIYESYTSFLSFQYEPITQAMSRMRLGWRRAGSDGE